MKGYSFLQRSLAISIVLALGILSPAVSPSGVSSKVEAASAAEWTAAITVDASPEGMVHLKLGVRDGATDLFDEDVDVMKPPPGMGADAWLETDDPTFTWVYEDYRGPATAAVPTIYWELHVQSESSGITISWDDSEIPEGSVVQIKLINIIASTFPTTLPAGSYWFAIRVTPPDTTPPVITLLGDNPMTVECGDPYVEPGANASDETCITDEVAIGGDTVDTGTVGTYYVTYDVSDCAGNPAVQVIRTVNVVDTTAPTITLLGDNPMTVECGDNYVEPGATASDDCCITDPVAIGGDTVDTGTVGTYYVTYDVSDCAGNPAAQVIRTVNVVDIPDTTPPVITLLGDNPMTVECGDTYVEPGATASDDCCITDPVAIGGDTVDTGTVGTYYVTYDVSDCAGNPAAQVIRTVNVVDIPDTTPPVITLLGDNPMTVECGDPYVEPGATASDDCCITDPVAIGGDTVDTGTVGTYYVTYDVSDCAGNPAAQVIRTVNVVDTTAPTITLLGDNPMTVKQGDPYVEPGATASDDCCITDPVAIGGDTVDTGTVGTYYVTYDVSDCAGNPAVQVIRTVNVVDTTAPTITLLGDNPMTVECGDNYVEPGATASDDCCITDPVAIGGDTVDTGTVGTYYVTYDVSDCAGNPAVQVIRTVNVVDTTAPTITLLGDNPMTVECGDNYVEPGATASDDCCITDPVAIGGDTVDTGTVGTYYVTYDVSDCAGNPAVQVIRTVNVVDTTAPTITLLGDNPMTVQCGDTYVEPGATASDDCCITDPVAIGGDTVDTGTVGTYYVTYDVSDCAGNPAVQVIRTVNVVDTTAPTITLLGDNPMTVECGDNYVEPGATASDDCCITDPVAIGGDTVDTGTVGTYYVTYDVSDCAGNPAVQVIRTVNVVDIPDTTPPVITLLGDNPMTVECGDTYVEPGATASDDCCITDPVAIGGDTVDTGTPGTYYVTYDVSDCAGNPADQVIRTVNVVDTTAPTITLLGDNPMTVECGDNYVEPGATASDDCCITDPVAIGGDTVDTGTVGTYYVTYDVSDCAGNPAAQVIRTVNVVDTTAPTITLLGDNPMTVECGDTYVEPGATASDDCCITDPVAIGGDTVDTGTVGAYNVTYDVSDCAGNPAVQVVRTVNVVDTTAPTITLLGDNPMTVECGDPYVEPGATASDDCCVTDPVAIGGDTVDTGTPATYYVTYDVSDCAGNPAVQVTRTVNVVDTTAPSITLLGDNPMTVECGGDYIEPGANASDETCITDEVTIGGDIVDTGTVGTYYVTYDVSDCAGNPAVQVVRTVDVVDITAPTITLLGDNPMTVKQGETYSEPGATVADSCCITDEVTIGGDTVDTGTVGAYNVTYDVSDCAGNPAVQVIRTVNVVEPADTTPPVITLLGDNPMTVQCGDPYVEPGANATDETCITDPVAIGGDVVDTGTVGTYYVTYDVSDCAGNPAVQVIRTVNVVDTTAPTITLLGDNPMTVECGDTYVEPGATASDDCCITDPVAIGGDTVDTGTVDTYYVTYDVSDCAGNPAVQVIRTVNVVDTTMPPPTMRCRPMHLRFSAREDGNNPKSRTLTIRNAGVRGCAPLEWTVSDDADWLTLSFTSGTTMRCHKDCVTVSVDTSGMSAGLYTAIITIEAPGATNTPQQVLVTLRIR